MVKYIVFALLSIPLIIISWRTLFNLRGHGFYRFLSWECILWLSVHNCQYWFKDPFRPAQIISWIFLTYSLFLIVYGVVLMRKTGEADSKRQEKELYDFEKTTVLIDSGLFRYIRHPLYGSLLFLTWGIFFKRPETHLLIISFLSAVFLIITSKIEEMENISFFGEKYLDYQKKTKMFVPFLF
ncbi:MAG: isoprenylcysteine carboxylmethyltransferase family protein [Bacteroidales bacterium]|nr:isoprenylcysteine carboxylmethyltransferase family protein [Bacteroidales bacterium]